MADYECRIRGDLSEADADLLVQIGFALEKGTVFEQNYPAAISFYSAAAGAGNAQAMNNIGWMLENGLGTDRDVHLAVEAFADAAQNGSTCAMVNLGNVYEIGLLDGTPDYKKAFIW